MCTRHAPKESAAEASAAEAQTGAGEDESGGTSLAAPLPPVPEQKTSETMRRKLEYFTWEELSAPLHRNVKVWSSQYTGTLFLQKLVAYTEPGYLSILNQSAFKKKGQTVPEKPFILEIIECIWDFDPSTNIPHYQEGSVGILSSRRCIMRRRP